MSTIIIITSKKQNAAADFPAGETAEDRERRGPANFDNEMRFDNVPPEVEQEVVDLLLKKSDDPGC